MSYPAIRCNNLKIFGYNPDVFFGRSALQVDFSPELDGPCPGCSQGTYNPGSDDTLFSSCVHTAETVFFECGRVDGRLRDLQGCIRGQKLPGFLVLHRMGQPCLLCRQEAGRYPDFRAKKLGIKNKRHKDTVRCIPCAFSDAGRPEHGIGPYRHLDQGLYPAEIPVSCFKVLERDPSL